MVERFDPYRISGVLEQVDGRWLWRHYHDCEPLNDLYSY